MIKFIIASFVAFSVQAQASSQFERYQELCELQAYEEDIVEANLTVVQELDIKKVTELSAELVKMVNVHLLEREYVSRELSFAEIKELFTSGEEKYNDLYIITLQSKASGREYIHVNTFPGDNPYGAIFLAKTSQLVAWNSDGSISIVDGQRTVSCPWN